MTALVLIGFGVSIATGWWVVEWWTVRRPLVAPTEQGRRLRLERIEQGKPLRYRCTDCGRKIKKHGHSPSFSNSDYPHDMAICDTCIVAYPDRDDWSKWMGFDIVWAA